MYHLTAIFLTSCDYTFCSASDVQISEDEGMQDNQDARNDQDEQEHEAADKELPASSQIVASTPTSPTQSFSDSSSSLAYASAVPFRKFAASTRGKSSACTNRSRSTVAQQNDLVVCAGRLMEQAENAFSSAHERVQNSNATDEATVFGNHIASEMRTLHTVAHRRTFKKRIMKCVIAMYYEFDEYYVNPDVPETEVEYTEYSQNQP